MTGRARLVTSVDVDVDDQQSNDHVSISTRHELELADGRRILLLDDRGWGSSAPWTMMSATAVADTSRVVVGPDEPFDDLTEDAVAADHWRALAETAERQGAAVDAAELRQLRHDVVLSERVLARLARGQEAPGRRAAIDVNGAPAWLAPAGGPGWSHQSATITPRGVDDGLGACPSDESPCDGACVAAPHRLL